MRSVAAVFFFREEDRSGGWYVLQEDIFWTFIVCAVPRIGGLRDSLRAYILFG